MTHLFKDGRLTATRKDVVAFTSSFQSDKRIEKAVIEINKAHIIMLMEKKIIDWAIGVKLLQALCELKQKNNQNCFVEDVHMKLEEEIVEKTGWEIGGNLHIAKSRNDQVATAIRMEQRNNIIALVDLIIRFQKTLIKLAKEHVKTVIPGYTHLQPAQPVTFAHYLLSHVDSLERSVCRLEAAYTRVNLCPMGAGAIATTSFPIDRIRVAELLGFNNILENSIDAVNSRDFILETLADFTILAVEISRLTEDFIIWSSLDFKIIDLPDNFSSTSSIMPQKKNPDVLEVIRARMSVILGNFVTAITTMKSLPSTYNLDFQEVTPKLWESIDTLSNCLSMLIKVTQQLTVNKEIFNKSFLKFSTMTELVNLLFREYSIPFRTAHKIVGALTKELIKEGLTLSDAPPELIHKLVEKSVGNPINIKMENIKKTEDPFKFVETHNTIGGPAPIEVERMIKDRKKRINWTVNRLEKKKTELDRAKETLQSTIKTYMIKKEKFDK